MRLSVGRGGPHVTTDIPEKAAPGQDDRHSVPALPFARVMEVVACMETYPGGSLGG